MADLRVTLSHTFPSPVGEVLRDFEISVASNEIVAILGPSGAGKTTILRRLAGLLPHDAGEEQAVPPLGTRDFVFLFQRPELVPWRTLEENGYLEVDVLGEDRALAAPIVETFLDETHLTPYRDLAPDEASAGMLQRAQLLRTAARKSAWYLFDEPLGAVDQPLRIELATELRRLLKERNAQALWVTHDALEAVTVADRVVVVAGRPLRVVHTYNVDRGRLPRVPSAGAPETNDDQAEHLRRTIQVLPTAVRFPAVPATTVSDDARAERPMSLLGRGVAVAIPFALLVLVWAGIVALRPRLAFFISSPAAVAEAFAREMRTGAIPKHIAITLREAGIGFALAFPFAIALGFVSTLTPRVSAAVRPYLVGATAVPLFVLAPAFILWFGIGERMKIAIAAASAFPFIAQHVHDAAHAAKGPLFRYLRAAGAATHRQYRYIVAPFALESAVQSIRPAAVAALLGAFLGEFIAAEAGLGYYIVFQASRYRMAEVLVGIATLFLIAIIIDATTRAIATRHLRVLRSMTRKRVP